MSDAKQKIKVLLDKLTIEAYEAGAKSALYVPSVKAVDVLDVLQPTHQAEAKPVDGELRERIAWILGLGDHPTTLTNNELTDLNEMLEDIMLLVSAHLQAAVQAERDRWQAASMQRLAKYDETGVPPETQALIDRAVAEAETNAVAWTVSVLNDLHNLGSYSVKEDRLYKGAKNAIRIRFEKETGIDPAPHYPVTAKLQQLKQEGP